MKKILLLMTVLVIAAACTTPTETTNRNAPATNANMATETKPAAMTEAEATRLEKSVWDAIKNKDYDGFGNMLANDMIYVGSDTVSDKPASIEGVKTFEIVDVTFSDWKYLPVDKDAAVVTYTAKSKVKMNGKEMDDTSRCSSAWVNRDGKWLSIYHQETPVKPAQPAPAAANKPKPATSPAATASAVVTSSDPVANEKAIWDALKAKNWDGFASALAPESIEVEPDGVYDKAGSIKTVSQFDFSKATLSDFKTVKFDDDASFVTYLVKGVSGAPPAGERHSTIWANRSAKWLAVFHQGTPVVPMPAAKPGASPAASPGAKPAASPGAKPAASPRAKTDASPAAKPAATK